MVYEILPADLAGKLNTGEPVFLIDVAKHGSMTWPPCPTACWFR